MSIWKVMVNQLAYLASSKRRRILTTFTAVLSASISAYADTTTQAQAQRIVSQYAGVFTSPANWGGGETPNGPLMGNGDLGITVNNGINNMQFIMAKNEFWSLSSGSVKSMAFLSLSIPGMSGASFAMQENIASGELTGQYTLNGNTITTLSWVQGDDSVNNRFFTQFLYTGSGTQTVTVSFAEGSQNTYPSSTGTSGSVLYFNVAADPATTFNGYNTCQVRVAAAVVGATGTIVNGNQLQFTLTPGVPVTLATSTMSNYDSSNYQNDSISNVNSLTAAQVSEFQTSHENWWANYWAKSFIEIPDKTIEKEYYGSLYLLACVMRAGEAPPGLFGNWMYSNPFWQGDYTLNYNFETPFYATFPTNHVELADGYDAAVLNWIPNAEAEAASNGWTGAFFRVHIGPLPNGSADTSVHNQKFNGAFAATPILMHYYYTGDINYANQVYPALKEIATFWQNYLSFDGTYYDILQDAQLEDDAYPQTNGVLSLGLVRFLLQGVIDMSTALNVDAATRATWQNELNHIAKWSTFTENGQTVFQYTSQGRQWATGNGISIQQIYPASQVGIATTSTYDTAGISLVTLAQNTINQMTWGWNDGNATNTFYPAAARVGYNPSTILSNLDNWINNNTYPNLHIHTGGGGEENENTVPSTMCEMLLQSFQGTMRVFSDWPSNTNAKFGDLLAYNNFLVSSSMVSNAVQYVRIISQGGATVSILNPWSGQTVQVYRNGNNAGTVTGTTLVIPTVVGDVLMLAPNGTSLGTINSDMTAPLVTPADGPFGGAAAVPGTVQAENYDLGGSGVAYFVNSVNGTGNSYRSDGVDLEQTADTGGGSDVGWTSSGQWFKYTVNVATAGVYTVSFRIASPGGSTGAFHLTDADGTDVSGPVNVPATGGWQTWATITATVTLQAGQQVLTLNQDNGGWNVNWLSFALVTAAEGPYGGTAASVPGTVQAENYDTGGEGLGYHVTSVNGTGNSYRSDGVNLEATADTGGGSDLGWTLGGQWFRYTVNVAQPGVYAVGFRVADPSAVTDAFHLSDAAGNNLTGPVNLPATGGWQTWTTVWATLELPAGVQTLTLNQDNGGWNVNWMAFGDVPFNVNAIYTNGTAFLSNGGADQHGDALSATLLGPATTWNGTTFVYGPANLPSGASNVTIPLMPGSFASLNMLAFSWGGGQASQTFTINYSDGTHSVDTQSVSDWCGSSGYTGETKVVAMPYLNTASGGETTIFGTCYVYGYTLAANNTKTVASITLPANSQVNVVGVQDEYAQTIGVVPYNVPAIYQNGATFPSNGGADQVGDALSATLLGSATTWNGTTFTYGPANVLSGMSNNVTIPLWPGSFSSLNMLAFSWGGGQGSQTFTINYSDGTQSTDTQSVSDWCGSSNYTGETKVVTMPYRNTASGGEQTSSTCYVYGYTLAANGSKTVSSITIPANSHVVVLGVQDQQ